MGLVVRRVRAQHSFRCPHWASAPLALKAGHRTDLVDAYEDVADFVLSGNDWAA